MSLSMYQASIPVFTRMLGNLSVDPGPALLAESVEQMKLMGQPNQIEAVRANMEKRAPKFTD